MLPSLKKGVVLTGIVEHSGSGSCHVQWNIVEENSSIDELDLRRSEFGSAVKLHCVATVHLKNEFASVTSCVWRVENDFTNEFLERFHESCKNVSRR